MLEDLCEALVGALDVSAPGFLHSVPAAMQALSSIGRVAPAVFAQHAAAVADFVLEVTQQLGSHHSSLTCGGSTMLAIRGRPTSVVAYSVLIAFPMHWPLSLVAELALQTSRSHMAKREGKRLTGVRAAEKVLHLTD